MCASTTSAKARSSAARSPGATFRQAAWAATARAIAASAAAAEVCSTCATGSSVAGLSTVNVVMPSPSLFPLPSSLPRLQPLEAALQLPVGHRGVECRQFDPRAVGVVLDYVIAERLAGQVTVQPGVQRVPQRGGHPGARASVGIAL